MICNSQFINTSRQIAYTDGQDTLEFIHEKDGEHGIGSNKKVCSFEPRKHSGYFLGTLAALPPPSPPTAPQGTHRPLFLYRPFA